MIVTCRECRKERSSHAKICPHCGLDVEEDLIRRANIQGKGSKAKRRTKLAFRRNPELKKKSDFWGAMGCLPVLIFILGVVNVGRGSEIAFGKIGWDEIGALLVLLAFVTGGFVYFMISFVNNEALKALSKSDKKKSKRQK